MILLKSSLCSAAFELEETSQLSNPENNMDVARCIIKSKYKVTLRQVEYVLRVRPDTNEWSKDRSTNEARHEKDSN